MRTSMNKATSAADQDVNKRRTRIPPQPNALFMAVPAQCEQGGEQASEQGCRQPYRTRFKHSPELSSWASGPRTSDVQATNKRWKYELSLRLPSYHPSKACEQRSRTRSANKVTNKVARTTSNKVRTTIFFLIKYNIYIYIYRREGFIHTGVFHPCACWWGLVKDPGLLSLLLSLFRGLGPCRLHWGSYKS